MSDPNSKTHTKMFDLWEAGLFLVLVLVALADAQAWLDLPDSVATALYGGMATLLSMLLPRGVARSASSATGRRGRTRPQ